MDEGSIVENIAVLLLKYLNKLPSPSPPFFPNTHDLYALSDDIDLHTHLILYMLKIFFPPNGDFEQEPIARVKCYLLQVKSIYTEIYDYHNTPQDKFDCSNIARAMINDDLHPNTSELLSNTILDEIKSGMFNSIGLISLISSRPSLSRICRLSFSEFLLKAYSLDHSQLGELDESYYVELSWYDISILILRRFSRTFEKDNFDDLDTWQIVSLIVDLFYDKDPIGFILLYYLRVCYLSKYRYLDGKEEIAKKLPNPLPKILDSKLLFSALDSYVNNFSVILISLLSGNIDKVSIKDMALEILTSPLLTSNVFLSLYFYIWYEDSARGFDGNCFAILDGYHKEKFLLERPSLSVIPMERLFPSLLEMMAPSFSISIQSLKLSVKLEEFLSMRLVEIISSYQNSKLHMKIPQLVNSVLPGDKSFSSFISNLFDNTLSIALIYQASLPKDSSCRGIEYFLVLVLSILEPNLSELRKLESYLTLLRALTESTHGSKSVSKLLFFLQIISKYFKEDYSSYTIDEVRTIASLLYLNLDVLEQFVELRDFYDNFFSYILNIRKTIYFQIKKYEVSNIGTFHHGQLDHIPLEVINTWIPLLRENELSASLPAVGKNRPEASLCSEIPVFDPDLDILINRIPADLDYKYYLLNFNE